MASQNSTGMPSEAISSNVYSSDIYSSFHYICQEYDCPQTIATPGGDQRQKFVDNTLLPMQVQIPQ